MIKKESFFTEYRVSAVPDEEYAKVSSYMLYGPFYESICKYHV